MKRILFCFFLFTLAFKVQAQFSENQVLEKQFENSNFYFQRFFLNTFGLANFSAVSPAFFEDPFLRLKLNPAYDAADSIKQTTFYLDYRNQRQELVPKSFILPAFDYQAARNAYFIPPNPRWYRISRSEPEPVLSAGFRSFLSDRIRFTLAYQLIYKEEPFYRQPIYFYQPNPYYDVFNQRIIQQEVEIPQITRRQQNDQTLTRAHLLATYFSYRLNSALSIGLGGDFVNHKRQSDYLSLYRGAYPENADDFNSYNNNRTLNYRHNDFFAGITWQVNRRWQIGWQAGVLNGQVKQNEIFDDSTHYAGDNYATHSRHLEELRFNHQGNRLYSTLSFQFEPNQKNKVFGFVNYAQVKYDINNRSDISNRQKSDYNYRNGLEYQISQNISRLLERRRSTGRLKENFVESMVTVMVKQGKRSRMHMGIYYSYLSGQKDVSEPVFFDAYSSYYSESDLQNTGHFVYRNNYRRKEDKTLYWKYRYTRQTIQMPLYWWHQLADKLAFFVIINKLWTAWEISEITDAYYKERYDLHDGQEEINRDFVERYETDPARHYTEDKADLALGFEAPLIDNVLVRYLINPDLTPEMRISQWWLSLTIRF